MNPRLRSFHVSPRLQAVYVNNPKAGCSTVKLALQQAELDDPTYAPDRSVHDRAGSPLLTCPDLEEDQLATLLSDYVVFSFVRNPFDRLRSAYLNKIFNRQKQGKPREQAGFTADYRPDFREFVLSVTGNADYRRNLHWRPQVENLHLGTVAFDFIGQLEHFDRDWHGLARRLDLPATPERAGKRIAPAKKAALTFDREMQRAVIGAYRRDFDLLGYAYGVDDIRPVATPVLSTR